MTNESLHHMLERHKQEIATLQISCQHKKVKLEDSGIVVGGERRILIKCEHCLTLIFGWVSDNRRARIFHAEGWKEEKNEKNS